MEELPMLDGPIASIEEPGIKVPREGVHDLRRAVADLLQRGAPNFPGAQPVSFARKHLDHDLRERDYYVCEKSDGLRYLMYSTKNPDGSEAHYLIDRKNDYWYINNQFLHFPLVNDREGFHDNTITDGELVWDELPDGRKEPRFLIFDCLVMDGTVLLQRPLDKRLAYVNEKLVAPFKKLLKEFPQEKQYMPFQVEMKPFQFAYGIEMMFKSVLPGLTHGNDGLIFTCKSTPYHHGTDPHILKWKPPEENTVDCRLKLTFPTVEPNEDERAEGITEPFIDYESVPRSELTVFKGGRGPDAYDPFEPVHISEKEWETLKSLDDPLDERIVECNVDEQGRWRIVRFRDDKHEANHESTVKSVLESIQDKVSEKDLYQAAKSIRDEWKAREAREKQLQREKMEREKAERSNRPGP